MHPDPVTILSHTAVLVHERAQRRAPRRATIGAGLVALRRAAGAIATTLLSEPRSHALRRAAASLLSAAPRAAHWRGARRRVEIGAPRSSGGPSGAGLP
jgi:hypothetical protein